MSTYLVNAFEKMVGNESFLKKVILGDVTFQTDDDDKNTFLSQSKNVLGQIQQTMLRYKFTMLQTPSIFAATDMYLFNDFVKYI
jgi:hypothetical protein